MRFYVYVYSKLPCNSTTLVMWRCKGVASKNFVPTPGFPCV